MAEIDERTRPGGRVFRARSQVLSAEDVRRAMVRIAHEVLERNHGTTDLVVVGLQTGGAPLARRLAELLAGIDGTAVPCGTLDVAHYRDDVGLRPVPSGALTEIPVELTGKVVVLVDDVLYTGRTVRAALDALADHGRARSVQLAVLIDRGHRELPIRPDYVGKNLPTRDDEVVDVSADGVAIGEMEVVR
ncbi:MAG TPA: bifunctional pyr operon transcriptional regulator/uracil phosphoribosyltransferase PyrR [Polyangiaceae bacterium]